MALRHRVGLIVIDNFDEIERLARLVADGAGPRGVAAGGAAGAACGSRRTSAGETHEKISTGQADSKFGFAMDEAGEAIARVHRRRRDCRCRVCTRTSARSCSSWSRFGARPRSSPSSASSRCGTSAAGSACSTPRSSPSRRRSRSTSARSCRAAHGHGMGSGGRLLIEPGRALCANAGVTLYTVRERQAERLALGGRRRRHVRQPAPDALRRAYEAHVADRFRRTRMAVPASACWRASTASPAT